MRGTLDYVKREQDKNLQMTHKGIQWKISLFLIPTLSSPLYTGLSTVNPSLCVLCVHSMFLFFTVLGMDTVLQGLRQEDGAGADGAIWGQERKHR